MRKHTKWSAAIFVAVLSLVFITATGLAEPPTRSDIIIAEPSLPAGCHSLVTFQEFRPFSKSVWAPSKWNRGKPNQKVIDTQRHMLRCSKSPQHRHAMQRRWRQDKSAFFTHRHKMRVEAAYQTAIDPPGIEVLVAIAACESGGDPTAVSESGDYRGKYQFDYRTWESVGGSGDPAAASEKEQDERAATLYNQSGSSPWPICGV